MGKKARKRARMISSNSNMSSAPPTPTDNLTYAIHSANETIYGQQTLEAKQVTSVTFADISKAFDTVWVKTLLYKLGKYGIKGDLLCWLNSYLSNRKGL